ncbi:DEAD/DEAH box helicase [Streptomyces sp. NPDC048290]|uniref:DEAD/DEAH box helicase n=1 Tax=Streptomyces sp. NPDC048290 TaxID=3155811 RepID=UPI00343934D6
MPYGSPCGGRRPPGTVSTTPALASHRAHRRGKTLTTSFRELGILPETAEALEAVGIVTPFPIQEMTLPVALSGTDVIGQAKTGTGKTLGFGLPLLERVTVPADVEAGRAAPDSVTDAPQALIVVPTRELCQQVTNDLLTAGKVRNVRVTAIYGGRAYEPQVDALRKGVDVVVGTPGRLLDLAGQKKLNLKHVRCLVLDEADEMLDLGFLPDVEKIIDMLPAKRQTMLFSATMPGAVIGLARRYMSQPTHIRATAPDDEGATVANIAQHVYRAHNMDKPELVARILQADGRGLAMVFCRTKRTAADLADQLKQRGFASGAVHGDLGQGAREQALRAFRNGKVDVLVCTDVAARGIDVEGVTHVINYQSPEDEKTYLHRIGRTGRAGASGTAITLVDWDDIPRWQLINKALELNFNDPPETYSTSPHLFAELSIPAGTKGILPRSERTRAGLDAEELEDLGEPGGRGQRGRGARGESRGDRGDRSGRPDRSERSDHAERERPARTPRRRRRTRGGTPLEAGAVQETAAPAVTPAAEDEATGPRTPRRRRRTRSVGQAPAPVAEATTEAVASVTTAEGPATLVAQPSAPPQTGTAELESAPAKPRRRRTRKSAEPAETTGTTGTTGTAEPTVTAEAVAAPEAPAALPELVEAVGAVEAVAAVEAKPRRRTRKTAAPAPAETVDAAAATALDTAEGAEAAPKARRTRKTAVKKTAAEPEVTAEAAAEAKPKRTRKKATAAAPEAVLDTVEDTAAEAKPKRAPRKKAAAAPVTTDAPVTTGPAAEAEPEVKPKRTRKKATTTATAATTAVDTAEGAEAKPKRTTTRKTAATKTTAKKTAAKATADAEATADAPVADAAEAKPKRAPRKKAAAAIPAQATAGEADAEPKPRVRRTRKATVAAEPTEG